MLSKNKIKLIQSLSQKKHRDEASLFLVEGNKMVEEALLSGFQIELLVCTSDFNQEYSANFAQVSELIETDTESIRKASLQQNPQNALAIVRQPPITDLPTDLTKELVLCLDFIQDPGNLGTILRIADWFGISTVICSENTVDTFNPKVVQASMGAIFRTKTWHTRLPEFLGAALQNQIPVYGTFLEGNTIYSEILSDHGIILLGNEGKGISPEAASFVTRKLYIPSYSVGKIHPESLNVAVAAAICCSEFRRRF